MAKHTRLESYVMYVLPTEAGVTAETISSFEAVLGNLLGAQGGVP